jgi:glucosyl-dolichyl phosphate glucuronosyltransferase
VVHHFVPAERVTWAYFWRRCFFVNRGKVTAFRNMGEARNLAAERSFVLRSITKGVWSEVLCVVRGDPFALPRMGAIILGVSLGAGGYAVGWAESALQLRRGAFQALRKASR